MRPYHLNIEEIRHIERLRMLQQGQRQCVYLVTEELTSDIAPAPPSDHDAKIVQFHRVARSTA